MAAIIIILLLYKINKNCDDLLIIHTLNLPADLISQHRKIDTTESHTIKLLARILSRHNSVYNNIL